VTRALLILAVLAGGCERSRPPEPQTRRNLEAAVAACEREPRRDCDSARRSLAEARREERLAAYRQAM
jgi:hypothetical protein